tara:strand:- start:35 stop:286 length:252 start_codon:yes stop_codon:yes gene_type:complete
MSSKLDKRMIRTSRGDMMVTGKQLSDALDKVRTMGLKDEDANDMVINILLEMTSKDKALGGAIQKIKKKRKKKRLGGKITYNY